MILHSIVISSQQQLNRFAREFMKLGLHRPTNHRSLSTWRMELEWYEKVCMHFIMNLASATNMWRKHFSSMKSVDCRKLNFYNKLIRGMLLRSTRRIKKFSKSSEWAKAQAIQFNQLINYCLFSLFKIREHGIQTIEKARRYTDPPICSSSGQNFQSVRITECYAPFLVLCYGMVTALLFLIFEAIRKMKCHHLKINLEFAHWIHSYPNSYSTIIIRNNLSCWNLYTK